MVKRLATSLAVVGVLASAPLALARHTTVGASAQINGSAAGYTLTLTNTGTEAIRCVAAQLPGTVSSAGPTSGWQVMVAGTDARSFVGYSLPGTTSAPGPGIAPGASVAFSFTTTGTTQGMTIFLSSSSCLFGPSSPQAAPITGPAPTPTPTPAPTTTSVTTTAPAACACSTLRAVVSKVERVKLVLGADPAQVMALRLHLQWSMQCTGGTGACSGHLSVHGTPTETQHGLLIDSIVNYNGTLGARSYDITCHGTGSCSAPQTGTATFYVAGHGAFNDTDLGTKIKRITLIVHRTCSGVRTPLAIVLAFGADGRIDLANSDLNGDHKLDG